MGGSLLDGLEGNQGMGSAQGPDCTVALAPSPLRGWVMLVQEPEMLNMNMFFYRTTGHGNILNPAKILLPLVSHVTHFFFQAFSIWEH